MNTHPSEATSGVVAVGTSEVVAEATSVVLSEVVAFTASAACSAVSRRGVRLKLYTIAK